MPSLYEHRYLTVFSRAGVCVCVVMRGRQMTQQYLSGLFTAHRKYANVISTSSSPKICHYLQFVRAI